MLRGQRLGALSVQGQTGLHSQFPVPGRSYSETLLQNETKPEGREEGREAGRIERKEGWLVSLAESAKIPNSRLLASVKHLLKCQAAEGAAGDAD